MSRRSVLMGTLTVLLAFSLAMFVPGSARAVSVGDTIVSVIPAHDKEARDRELDKTCADGTKFLASGFSIDLGSTVTMVAIWRLDGSIRAVEISDFETHKSVLYGDRKGDGNITDIGIPKDSVFGRSPCDYYMNTWGKK